MTHPIAPDSGPLLRALEEFVVNNDELLDLEAHIGRFNIFDSLRIAHVEIRHSTFLSWLLDPAESHGQSSLFLRAILMDLLAQSPPDQRPLSPVELDGEELRGVEIRREWRNIDLLITCEEPRFVIAIENKVSSGEHGDQLDKYTKIIQEQFPDTPRQFVFLTVEGDEPSHADWVPYTYADIHDVLTRLRQTYHTSIGEDVLIFLDHYLRLLGSRFMDDLKIDDLCERIYKNHRQALELIFERVGSPAAGVVGDLEHHIRQDDRWLVVKKTSKMVLLVPRSWENMLPPIAKLKTIDPRLWLLLRFEVQKRGFYAGMTVRGTTDSELRKKLIDRLIRTEREFGLSTFFKDQQNISERAARLGRRKLASWKEDDGPDKEKIIEVANMQLETWDKRLAGVANALSPIIQEWHARQSGG